MKRPLYSSAPQLFAAEYAAQTGDVDFYRQLAHQHRERGALLELGVGTGRVFSELRKVNPNSYGVEYSAAMLAHLCQNDRTAARRTVRANCATLPFPSHSFALVVAPFNLLNELSALDCHRTLSEVRRVLVTGGIFATDTTLPDEDWLGEPVAAWRRGACFLYSNEAGAARSTIQAWTIQREYDAATGMSLREVAYVPKKGEYATSPFDANAWVCHRVRSIVPGELLGAYAELNLSVLEQLADFERDFDGNAASYVTVAQKVDGPA